MIDLQQGDCLDLMKDIPDGSIDMILCDLPYGTTKNKWDSVIPFDKLWEQYKRIIKDHGAILLFGQELFMAKLILSNEKNFRYTIIWDKVLTTGHLNANRMPLRSHETIVVFYKHLPTYNPQKTLGNPNHGVGSSIGKSPKSNNDYGKWTIKDSDKTGMKFPKSIITFKKTHPSISVHPTQKPVALLEYLIKTYTNDGDVVLDNTMGSGSTGVACVNTGRNFIGMELEPKYFKIAKERIKQAKKTASAFA